MHQDEQALILDSAAATPGPWTRALLRCGLSAGPVFVATFLLEGAARDGYRPLRHPVSSLALGPRGWVQTANFTVTGTLFLAGAAGLWRAGQPGLRRAGQPAGSAPITPALIGAAGAGLISAAVFPTDPVSGYPPGTPAVPSPLTRTGMAHILSALPLFAGLPVAALASSRQSWRAGRRGFSLYSAATALTGLATTILSGAGFGQSPRLVTVAGLLQRISIITGFTWITALSAQALRRGWPATYAGSGTPGS